MIDENEIRRNVMIFAVVVSALGSFFLGAWFALGLVGGSILSLLLFHHLSRTVEEAARKNYQDRGEAFKRLRRGRMFRVLYVCAFLIMLSSGEWPAVAGGALGLLSIKLTLFLKAFFWRPPRAAGVD